jgi:hypothetical protein
MTVEIVQQGLVAGMGRVVAAGRGQADEEKEEQMKVTHTANIGPGRRGVNGADALFDVISTF